MDCVNRRVLLWNEPACETSAYEDIKMLFGGDSMKVRVKYHCDAVIDRTPVFVLSNLQIFPNDDAFNTRMFKYNWQSFSYLKKINKSVNPFAIIELFKKIKIIDQNCKYIEEVVPSETSTESE